MGDPAPQTIVAVRMAIIPDMYSWYQMNDTEYRVVYNVMLNSFQHLRKILKQVQDDIKFLLSFVMKIHNKFSDYSRHDNLNSENNKKYCILQRRSTIEKYSLKYPFICHP